MCLTVAAQSATVSYTGTFAGGTDVTNQVINVAQFDSSLGTLVSATFELTATMNTSAYATNDGNFYVGWDKLDYQLSLAGTGAYSGVAISASNAPIRIVGTGPADGSFILAEALNVVGQPNWTQAGPILGATNTFYESPLGDYIGNGNLAFYLTTLNNDSLYAAGLQSGGLPNPAPFGVSTGIQGEVKVTYAYNVVPVPAAAWLFGGGLGALGALLRRQRR
ncbi:MAG: choice-of-anchor E domain-containing protein [Chromatiales bacterium]|nr:choice-of-anchor E domain-containing protein [Chromatiales bacterium]